MCIEWNCHLCTCHLFCWPKTCHLFCWPKVSLKNSATFFICTLTIQQILRNINCILLRLRMEFSRCYQKPANHAQKREKVIDRIRIQTIWCRISQSWKLFVCNVSRGCKSSWIINEEERINVVGKISFPFFCYSLSLKQSLGYMKEWMNCT